MLPLRTWDEETKYELMKQYDLICDICGVYPERDFIRQFHSGFLDLDLSHLPAEILETVCLAVTKRITPHTISIQFSDNTIKGDKGCLNKILKSLKTSVTNSTTLKTLQFSQIPVTKCILSQLCDTLSSATRLQNLKFEDCLLKDKATSEICQSIKNVYSIKFLSFDRCCLASDGGVAIKHLIMHQMMNRSSILWQDTLRTRVPRLERMNGLRRLRLNDNPRLGCEGASHIVSALHDDIWITGLEMENCGLTNKNGEEIMDLLKVNQALESISIKRNPHLSDSFLQQADSNMRDRCAAQFEAHPHLRVKESMPADHLHFCEESTGEERFLQPFQLPTSVWPPKSGVPAEVERRIIERREGLPAGSLTKMFTEIKRGATTDNASAKKEQPPAGTTLSKVRNLIDHHKSKVRRERRRRIKAEAKVKFLEDRLKSIEKSFREDYFVGEDTVEHIEECFTNFHQLLFKVKQIGFLQWQKGLHSNVAKELNPSDVENIDAATQCDLSRYREVQADLTSKHPRLQTAVQIPLISGVEKTNPSFLNINETIPLKEDDECDTQRGLRSRNDSSDESDREVALEEENRFVASINSVQSSDRSGKSQQTSSRINEQNGGDTSSGEITELQQLSLPMTDAATTEVQSGGGAAQSQQHSSFVDVSETDDVKFKLKTDAERSLHVEPPVVCLAEHLSQSNDSWASGGGGGRSRNTECNDQEAEGNSSRINMSDLEDISFTSQSFTSSIQESF